MDCSERGLHLPSMTRAILCCSAGLGRKERRARKHQPAEASAPWHIARSSPWLHEPRHSTFPVPPRNWKNRTPVGIAKAWFRETTSTSIWAFANSPLSWGTRPDSSTSWAWFSLAGCGSCSEHPLCHPCFKHLFTGFDDLAIFSFHYVGLPLTHGWSGVVRSPDKHAWSGSSVSFDLVVLWWQTPVSKWAIVNKQSY